LNFLHELPPNETLSGLNQKISTSTESVIEVLNKLRQETTTTTTTSTTTTIVTTTTTSEPSTVTDYIETSTTSLESDFAESEQSIINELQSSISAQSTENVNDNVTFNENVTNPKTPLLRDGETQKNFIQVEKLNSLNLSQSDDQQLSFNSDKAYSDLETTGTLNEEADIQEDKTEAEIPENISQTSLTNDEEYSSMTQGPIDVIQPLDDLISEQPEIQMEENLAPNDGSNTNITGENAVATSTDITTTTININNNSKNKNNNNNNTIVLTSATTEITTTNVTSDPDDDEEDDIENEIPLDDQTLSSTCSNSSSLSCNTESNGSSLDVVLIAGVTVAIVVCLAILATTLSVWLCKKSHHRKNVYATMEEEQPKDFTKAGPPVILQDELTDSVNKPRLYLRHSDKVTEL